MVTVPFTDRYASGDREVNSFTMKPGSRIKNGTSLQRTHAGVKRVFWYTHQCDSVPNMMDRPQTCRIAKMAHQ